MQVNVSKATQRNWKKLNVSDDNEKLVSRANKQKSTKQIIPKEYILDQDLFSFMEYVTTNFSNKPIADVIFNISEYLLKSQKLINKSHVKEILEQFKSQFKVKSITFNKMYTLKTEFHDILGAVYQSLMSEGDKNKKGSYYTPRSIVNDMIADVIVNDNESFLDPCCGSGAFLLSVKTKNPLNLYGIEKDPIAVFIAKINLILKYKDLDFIPNIICSDFLMNDEFFKDKTQFDFIVTNPPWGNKLKTITNLIDSKESFVQFFAKSYHLLKRSGYMNFLVPESILTVKSHKTIRDFILQNKDLHEIEKYYSSFSGVVTNSVTLKILKNKQTDTVIVKDKGEQYEVPYYSFYYTKHHVFSLLKSNELKIIEQILTKSKFNLETSDWALGIVTGDNKTKLLNKKLENSEPIYTGKEIDYYTLKPYKHYIIYNRSQLQQVAKDEFYKAKEKLVYKFISNKLMFAYDNSQSLFLNSANILIPKIPNMSTKTVLAFLNSKVYQFIYTKLFSDIKILKGNLSELPFPEIDEKLNNKLNSLVDGILYHNKDNKDEINQLICDVFKISPNEIKI